MNALRAAAGTGIVFGAMTLVSGAAALFGPEAAVRLAGQTVPFVLWFNALAGVAYVVAGLALWRRRRWGTAVAAAIALATLVVAAFFTAHVLAGGAFEARTPWALATRIAIWSVIALIGWRALRDGHSRAA